MNRLLGLDGLAVDRVELDEDGIPVVDLVTADGQAGTPARDRYVDDRR